MSPELICGVEKFREAYPVDDAVRSRVVKPALPFYGKEVLEMAIAALLEGQNLLLTGAKATGKNVLAENLAFLFGRPVYNVSFHVNTSSAELIGTDNRRSIDIPGYEKIDLHPAARFIGTMNYGYAGTKELNEALVSRFLVIDMPPQTESSLEYILSRIFPDMTDRAREQLSGLFLDLQTKAEHGEISARSLDLRGIVAAAQTVRQGIPPFLALQMGVVNKCFDTFEKEIVRDVLSTRIPAEWTRKDVFA